MAVSSRILAIIVVAALIVMGTAVGEVSREELVGEWHFEDKNKYQGDICIWMRK